MKALESLLREIAGVRGVDPRSAVFDVRIEADGETVVLAGETTLAEAADELAARAAELLDRPVQDAVLRLPDPALGADAFALVRSAVAPVHGEPRLAATQVSQYVVGHRLDLLSRHGPWCRVRGEDGYIGWIHHGYLAFGAEAWALTWERGGDGEPIVSLGAELVDAEGRSVVRLPWGARVLRDAPGRFRLPDGRHGRYHAGELVEADRLADWFPPRGESVIRTARRWTGTPYLWGGVTPAGADCSGYVQSVFWMHGIALPRDSDQQARVGEAIDVSSGFAAMRPGDLLYFSEREDRVTHVAISLGGGRIIHSALSNGGVAENDLEGGRELEKRLRSLLTGARRVLPD